jgi:site-specific recombinase XerD
MSNQLQGRLGSHCMRKTFAAKVHIRTGGNLVKLQELLGHADLSSTRHYLASTDTAELDAIVLSL